MLVVPASEASAEYSTDNYRSAADDGLAIAATLVNTTNVCNLDEVVNDSAWYEEEIEPLLVPVEVGCNADYSIQASSNGATVEGEFDVFACVGTSCVVIPATLDRTGGLVYVDATFISGQTTIVALPKVCVTGICATEEPQEIRGVDPNNYYAEAFTAANEIELYHPFDTEPITVQVGDIIIDGGGGS